MVHCINFQTWKKGVLLGCTVVMTTRYHNKIQTWSILNYVNVEDLSIQTKADQQQPPRVVTGLLPLIFPLLTCTQTLFGGLCEKRLDTSRRDI